MPTYTDASRLLNSGRLSLVQGDITKLRVDAIVNAANTTLLGGGGVDGAIHRAAGPELLNECRKLGGCPTGDAKITGGHKLPSQFVIHTVGPVWNGGKHSEDELLRRCYLRSLELAQEKAVKTIAFPCISTGVYHFPMERASRIAIETVSTFLEKSAFPEKVIFCCFSAADLEVYRKLTGVR